MTVSLIQTVHLSVSGNATPRVIRAVQNDTGRKVKMIPDDLALASGMTGAINFRRADGTYYYAEATLDTSDNSFTAELDQALTCPGKTYVQLKVTDTDLVSTFSFVIEVERDTSGTLTPQEGMSIQQAVEAAEDAADRAESAAEELGNLTDLPDVIAPAFSTSVAYSVGDYVMYNGHLYRFTSAHSAGAWNAAHVVEVTVGDEIGELESGLNSSVNYELELGNINMSASGWNYYTSTTRVRVKQGETIALKKGAVIGLYDYASYRMYIGWNVGGVYKQDGWLTSDFICPDDANYTILVTKIPETTITIDEVKGQLFVFAYNHPLSNAYYGNRLANKAEYDYAVTIPVTAFQYGNIGTDGMDATTDIVSRARSEYIKVPKGSIVKANTIYVFEYDTSKKPRTNSGGFVNTYTVSADGYVRICEFISNGNVRSVTITYPAQIPSAYVSEYGTQKAEKWKNNWLYDCAHRGSNRYIAPDTLPAYVNAKNEGYNSIEGDIRVTSDGKYVIHHDDGMPSSSSYLISTHTLAELRANANMGYFNGEALPILELKEWLLLAKSLDMFVFAEMKATLTESQIIECMTIARDCGMQDRVAWMAELSNASVFRGFYPLCYLAITNTLNYASASQYALEQYPERTFIYTGTTNITDAFVANCASVGIGVVGWCVTYSWMFGDDWTEEQVKTEIKRALACGAKGMVLDYWTVADIYYEEYASYLVR